MCGIDYCFSQRAAEKAMLFLCLACFHEERTFSMYGENFSFCLGCFPVISYGQDNMLRISYYFYIFPLLSCLYKSRPLFSFVSKQCLASYTIRTKIVSELLNCLTVKLKAIYSTCCWLSFYGDFIERVYKLQYYTRSAVFHCCTKLFSDYNLTVCT